MDGRFGAMERACDDSFVSGVDREAAGERGNFYILIRPGAGESKGNVREFLRPVVLPRPSIQTQNKSGEP